jgi:hypothetical protein
MTIRTHASTSCTFFDQNDIYTGKMVESRDAAPVSAELGKILKGAYVTAGMTLESLSEATGIRYYTLRRKIAGEAPITVSDLLRIAGAINARGKEQVDPGEYLDRAVGLVGGYDALLSEAADTTIDLDARRKRQARSMTTAEIESQHGTAATHDPEFEAYESETP